MAPAITLLPFSSQTTTSPLSFCQRMSKRPSPLKSPVPFSCQLGPGLPRLPPPITLVPFSSQIPASPVSFCHRTSDLPSPLKSVGGRFTAIVAVAVPPLLTLALTVIVSDPASFQDRARLRDR